jgi:hypothetical protein
VSANVGKKKYFQRKKLKKSLHQYKFYKFASPYKNG